MKIMLAAISIIAILFFAVSIRPAYSEVVTKTVTVTVGDDVKGSVDTAGDIIDGSGQVIGHVLAGSALINGDVIAGIISANGDIVDANGLVIAHALSFAPRATTTTTTKTVVTKTTALAPDVTKEIIVTPGTVVLAPHPLAYSVGDPSVDARRHELELRIGQDLVDNKITTSQAADLRNNIDELVALEANLMKGGCLTNEQARVLFTRYDRIGSKLDEFIAANRRVLM